MGSLPEIVIQAKGELGEAGRINRLLDEFLRERGVPMDALFDLQTATEEIVANIVRHGAAASITVRAAAEEGGCEVVFEDDGPEFNPLMAPEPNLEVPLQERQRGGLGIHLVRKLMDRLAYQRAHGRNRLSIFKRF